MAIKRQFVQNAKSKPYCDFGNNLNIESKNNTATFLYRFMAKITCCPDNICGQTLKCRILHNNKM